MLQKLIELSLLDVGELSDRELLQCWHWARALEGKLSEVANGRGFETMELLLGKVRSGEIRSVPLRRREPEKRDRVAAGDLFRRRI